MRRSLKWTESYAYATGRNGPQGSDLASNVFIYAVWHWLVGREVLEGDRDYPVHISLAGVRYTISILWKVVVIATILCVLAVGRISGTLPPDGWLVPSFTVLLIVVGGCIRIIERRIRKGK